MFRKQDRQPDFENLRLVLERKAPPRPVLFDFILGAEKEQLLTGKDYRTETEFERVVTTIRAFDSAGYDHAPIIVRGLDFKKHAAHQEKTKSLNDGAAVASREDFDRFVWPEITDCDFSIIRRAGEFVPKGMKLIPFAYDGILENTISILGYESLCLMLYDEPQLVEDVFFEVGSRVKQYYERCLAFDEVGAILCNDDWGFGAQTMVSPDTLRKCVFPWYREIVKAAHERGKPALLHSCGAYNAIIGDITDIMHFDGRHSYEDKIVPVETAYAQLHERIAVLGGVDVDFLARKTPEEVYARCRNLIALSAKGGGYALGSGNSVPDYIPNENFIAMLRTANEGY